MEEKKIIKYVINLEQQNEEEDFDSFVQNHLDSSEAKKIQLVKAMMDILQLTKNDKH